MKNATPETQTAQHGRTPHGQIHNIPPLYNEHSRNLILGSFPSVASRAEKFFYAHPQNRFWKVIAAVFSSPVPATVEEKNETHFKQPPRFVRRDSKLHDFGQRGRFR